MKQKIKNKIEGITAETDKKKLKKIEMYDPEQREEVNKILWFKRQCGKASPKIQIVRSGLPIKLTCE